MPVHVFQFFKIEYYVEDLHVCLIIMKLRRLKSTRAGACMIQIPQELGTGACITQNEKDCESRKLYHKHNYCP